MSITASWTTPIYDRTQADVDEALAYMSTISTTENWKKGCFNYTDWNRIVANCLWLKNKQTDWEYGNVGTFDTNEKTYNTILIKTDVDSLISNIQLIANNITTNVDLPTTISSFEDLNKIEKSISDIWWGLQDRQQQITGTFTIPALSSLVQTDTQDILTSFDNKYIERITITHTGSITDSEITYDYDDTRGRFIITLTPAEAVSSARLITYTIKYYTNLSRRE